MARTKQTSHASTSSKFQRATFGSERKPKKKPKQRKRWMSATERMGGYSGWEYDPFYRMANNLNHWQASSPPISTAPVIDLDEMGYDELDEEVMLGSIRGNIVGIQYYHGTVNNNEMVALVREPNNKYDKNAIKVTNVDRIQVGHIKRELAKPIAEIIDNNLARPEGVVPFGAKNAFSMPIDISLWGKVENQQRVMSMLRMCGFNGYMPSYDQQPSTSAGIGYAPVRRTFLSPSEIKNELDQLFENLEEGDKTSTTEPAKAVCTTMYTHQKQALHWMIQREKGIHLPPFWEERNGKFFNSVTVFTSNYRPKSVKGGILADDMGLGKTLEMIALIITNFKDDKPLALPVQGTVRRSKKLRALKKEQMIEEGMKEVKPSYKKLKLRFSEGEPGCSQVSRSPVPKTLSKKKILGLCHDTNLPESTDTDQEESDSGLVTEAGDAGSCMVKKEDPEYVPPELKEKKENISPVKSGRRPRRDVKRPARYVESDVSEDALEDMETPNKKSKKKKMSDDKAYHLPIGKGKGKGRKSACKVKLEGTNHHGDETVGVEEVKPIIKTEGPVSDKNVAVKVGTLVLPPNTIQVLGAKVNPIESLLASVELSYLKGIFDKEQITLDILAEMGHDDLKSIGISAFGYRHKIMKAAAKFVADALGPKNTDEVTVKTEISETKPSVEAEPKMVTKSSVKQEALEEIKPLVRPIDCDDLPDPSLNPIVVLETDPLDDLEEIGSQLAPGDFGEGTGRTETTGARSTLIICPLSVLNNWLDQLEDHVHELVHLAVYTYYGQSRTKDPKVLSQQDIVLTTYSTVTADTKGKANPLQKVDWLRLVLDEGHAIRNPNTQQTKAICSLKAERKWILTGTPIQNSMKDLWSLVNFLQISPFTDKQWWNRTIERPLNDGNENALRRVQHLMGAISMRRTKTMKINNKPIVELPERNVFIEHVKMSEEERLVYEAMQKEGKLIVSRYFNQGTLLHNYGDVLSILMRLRQMCCHPLLVAKAAAAVQETVGHLEPGQAIPDHLREKLVSKLLEVLRSGSDEECAICMDGLKEPVITHCAHVFCKRCIEAVIQSEKPFPRCPLCRGNVDTTRLLQPSPEELNRQKDEDQTDISSDTWKSSAKMDALINALVKLRQEEPSVKSLVVSQFTSLLSLIEIPLRMNGFNFVRLDGSMNLKQRHAAIAQLSNTCLGSPSIMLLSLTAGGVGVNLTAASRVFLMDPAWNPATEDQCFDRCHRLGQTRDVIVTKFIVDDSVEGRMMDLQEKKRALMQGAFGKKQSAEEKRANRIKDIKTLMDL